MSLPNLSLKGKVALVTGGSRGIGKGIALMFAEAGADVAICSRHLDELEVAAEEIRKLGRRALAVRADVTVKADVDNLIEKTVAEFGGIDILVNNAGTVIVKPLPEYAEEDWDRVLNTNLKSCYLCARAVSLKMIERQKGGNIINIASTRGIEAATGRIGYSVSKSAVFMLTRVLALELVGYGIRANSIAPGYVQTKLTEFLWKDPKIAAETVARVPMKRWGTVTDIASAALFLASDASSYMTGQAVVVDGGWTAV
jgi:NAD(P)-dependent dehydrogenase (short-subunit alcohol dehydrogenase family)